MHAFPARSVSGPFCRCAAGPAGCETEHSQPALCSVTLFPWRLTYIDDRAEMVSFCVFIFTLSCFLNLSRSRKREGQVCGSGLLLCLCIPHDGVLVKACLCPGQGLADRLPGGHLRDPGIKAARPVVALERGQGHPWGWTWGCWQWRWHYFEAQRGLCPGDLHNLGSAHSERGPSRKVVPSFGEWRVWWVLKLPHGLLVGPETFIRNQLLTDTLTYKYVILPF